MRRLPTNDRADDLLESRRSSAMHALDRNRLEVALTRLGETLAFRNQAVSVLVIGGSGLLLLGTVTRATYDVDIVAVVDGSKLSRAQPLPLGLANAARDVAQAFGLDPNWLNPGPKRLLDFGLPEGCLKRSELRRYGSLEVHVASRFDQIHFKLYAAVDQGPRSKHAADRRTLGPSRSDLIAAARWCRTHDPSIGFRGSLGDALTAFSIEVGDDEL